MIFLFGVDPPCCLIWKFSKNVAKNGLQVLYTRLLKTVWDSGIQIHRSCFHQCHRCGVIYKCVSDNCVDPFHYGQTAAEEFRSSTISEAFKIMINRTRLIQKIRSIALRERLSQKEAAEEFRCKSSTISEAFKIMINRTRLIQITMLCPKSIS